MTSKKLFTLEEANALIPQLLTLVPEIQKLSGSMDRDFPDIHNAREKAKWNGGSAQGTRYLNVILRYSHFTNVHPTQCKQRKQSRVTCFVVY